ncbi:hypothetical protein OOK58_55865 [Streptomyces sp. NBC_01728]|uniref:hypothetical protein n=1 Tax=unclassified Streptomyces TaxID=2593676 RepID=UPI00224FDC60|nr:MULTISPECIES: hypothetical protein [unclassified Streptomyces]MCX4460369.1 hypothetical protein [Streptomyces sp. NBC_01719]MCX4500301.1 hypothetical protein [Streptomyces sp. NBC_01728]
MDLVLTAHGGLDRGRQDKTIHATGAVGGPCCARAVRERTTVRIGPVSAAVARFLALVCAPHPLPADLVQEHGQPVPAPTSGHLALSAA